jgi:nucleoside-diphosphate-sugar epimerase
VTIADLAHLVGKISGVNVIFPDKDEDGMPGAPEDVRLDISRFSSEFGIREFIDLEKGLTNTIDWQRSLYL